MRMNRLAFATLVAMGMTAAAIAQQPSQPTTPRSTQPQTQPTPPRNSQPAPGSRSTQDAPAPRGGDRTEQLSFERADKNADGQVSRAGWAGGYGRQVRLVHGDGISTSYSHLSQIVADGGEMVRKGQLIGYVGSSGLATGPHLHYEVYRGGVAVNPMSVRIAGSSGLDEKALDALKARVRSLFAAAARKG